MKKIIPIIFSIIFVALAACTDDDSFTTSRTNTLTFSTDTVKLDTVFSRVPTATKTFWVYNHSGDGIRCSSVRLQNGNQTGFRVNVDGIYLGGSQGYQTNEIEIRDKDSIRVFVELTSPNNGASTPQLLEDNLIFTLESGVEQRVNLRGYTWDADIYGMLEVHNDTTISAVDKPLVIQQGLKVDSGATLTITPGSTIYFGQRAGANVYGRIVAEGTADANITFRGDRIDRMFDYLPYDRVPGQWQGIHFNSSSYENRFNYVDLHSAYNGVVCDSSSVERLKLQAYNTTIHNCQGYGLVETNCVVDLWNCQITNTLNDCAAFFGGGAMLRHCTIAQFYPFDANRGVALRFANYRDDKNYPLYQFDVYNTLVTGYADDVVMGDFHDGVDAAYMFDHCILRTVKPDTLNEEQFKNVVFENVEDTTAITGEKHFKTIDADMQYYDFHLDSLSTAIDSGTVLPNGYSTIDRDGRERDSRPDIGCYEFHSSTVASPANSYLFRKKRNSRRR